MYIALNERVIAMEVKQENATASGIILADKNSACVAYKVCYTNEITKDLQDKVIYAEARYKNHQLPNNGPNGEQYVVIPLAEILAVQS